MTEFTADSLFFTLRKIKQTVTEAVITKQGRLSATISDQVCEWPGVWLRYNCDCPSCFNTTSLSHVMSLRKVLQTDSRLIKTEIAKGGAGVLCTWSDGHQCLFTADWLFNRRITEEGASERKSILTNHETVAWSNPEDLVIQRASWDEVTETSAGFVKFGSSLIRDGVFIITATPDRYIRQEFADKTGALFYNTHYGQEFIVENRPDPVNLAYTTANIEFHVDQACLGNTPKIQFLHCLKQAAIGGENILTDGIKSANVLKERHPKHYEVLRTLKMEYEDLIAMPGEMHQYVTNTKPVINEDENGRPEYIILSNHGHSSFYNGDITDLENWLEAMRVFLEILYEFSVKIKTRAGDILVFDNKRILHGREPYNTSSARKLEGFYTDWDYVHSRLRVAQIKNGVTMEKAC